MQKDSIDNNEKPSIACYRKSIVMLFFSRHSSGSRVKVLLATCGLFNNEITRKRMKNKIKVLKSLIFKC